jgi:hypothetical protein
MNRDTWMGAQCASVFDLNNYPDFFPFLFFDEKGEGWQRNRIIENCLYVRIASHCFFVCPN